MNETLSDKTVNYLMIDSDILMRLYNKSFSNDEILELFSSILAFKFDVGYSVFTFFEFFKNVSSEKELERRMLFLKERFNLVLAYSSIGDDVHLNPEYWFDNNKFKIDEFQAFFAKLKSDIFSFVCEQLINFVSGIVLLTLFVKSFINNINTKCAIIAAIISNDDEMRKKVTDIYRKHLDCVNFDDFFNKQKSKLFIDDFVKFSLAFYNNFGDKPDCFKTVTPNEIEYLLRNKRKEIDAIKTEEKIDCTTTYTFCESYLMHISRMCDKSIVLTGLIKLSIDYIHGRRVSSNDFIDLLNINTIDVRIPNIKSFYTTKDKYWFNEFINKYAVDEDHIVNCQVVDLVNISLDIY